MKLVYSEIFDSAWKSIKDDLALSAGLTLVFLVGIGVCNRIPGLGAFLSMPLGAGYLRCLLQIRKRESFGYSDFFWAFQDFNRLLQLMLLNLIIWLGGIVGICLLVIPGIWWFVATSLSTQIFVLKDTDSISALKTSMALVKGRWWNIFGLGLLCGLLILAGVIAFFVGILVAFPVSAMAVLIAAEKLMSEPSNVNPTSNSQQGSAVPVETTIVPQ